jgi:hypothetical protein
MPQEKQRLILYDPPDPSATLETLEEHLAELRALPDNVALKREMIASVQWDINRKLRKRLH